MCPSLAVPSNPSTTSPPPPPLPPHPPPPGNSTRSSHPLTSTKKTRSQFITDRRSLRGLVRLRPQVRQTHMRLLSRRRHSNARHTRQSPLFTFPAQGTSSPLPTQVVIPLTRPSTTTSISTSISAPTTPNHHHRPRPHLHQNPTPYPSLPLHLSSILTSSRWQLRSLQHVQRVLRMLERTRSTTLPNPSCMSTAWSRR